MGSQFFQSQYFDQRSPGRLVDTIVIHSMHNTEHAFPYSLLGCKECLDQVGLSVHYLVGLDGETWQLVDESQKAWHAGQSKLPADGRTAVNDFSIGIEIIGDDVTEFTDDQYRALAELCTEISERHPIRFIVGHSDIAPERKTDPWGLDWERLQSDIKQLLPSGSAIRYR